MKMKRNRERGIILKLVLASQNKHKLEEFSRIMKPLGIEVISQKDAGVDVDPDENGTTFAQNAMIKAKAVFEKCGAAVVADDSGICVDALGGEPGIYSARYGGDTSMTDNDRLELLLKNMKDVPDGKRGAHFACAIACIMPNGDEIVTEKHCYGTIAHEKSGDGGFGYDPIFLVDGKSFADIPGEEKDKISHRGQALRDFAEKLEEYLNKNKNK